MMKIIVSTHPDNFDHATILVGKDHLFETTNFMVSVGDIIDATLQSGRQARAIFGDDSVFITHTDMPLNEILQHLRTDPSVTQLYPIQSSSS